MFGLNNYPDPSSLESAQYSLPFCLAVAVLKGKQALLPMTIEWLGYEEVETFARKVTLHVDPLLEQLFPARTAARVVLQTDLGVFEHRTNFPLGDPANPMLSEVLAQKFRVIWHKIYSHSNNART